MKQSNMVVYYLYETTDGQTLYSSSGLHKIEIGLGTKFQYKFSAWFSRNSYAVW